MKRNAYPVRDLDTGDTWPSVHAAARAIGANEASLREAIEQHRACKGRFLVLDSEDAYCACCKAKVEAKARGRLSLFRPLKEEVAAMVG